MHCDVFTETAQLRNSKELTVKHLPRAWQASYLVVMSVPAGARMPMAAVNCIGQTCDSTSASNMVA